MSERPSRELVVILHADVVSSTALVQRDEALAHQRIQDGFLRLSNTIEAYGGNAHELRDREATRRPEVSVDLPEVGMPTNTGLQVTQCERRG